MQLSAKVSELAKARLAAMTKAELQAYADERGIAGVDRSNQTKDGMIELIRRTTGL